MFCIPVLVLLCRKLSSMLHAVDDDDVSSSSRLRSTTRDQRAAALFEALFSDIQVAEGDHIAHVIFPVLS